MKKSATIPFIPLDDRILVRPDDPEKETKGGIIIPDRAQAKSTRGTVLAVGPGKRLENGERVSVSVEPGDAVIYSRYGGSDVEIDGEELKVLSENDILGKLEEE